jgi:hypothetical protein
MNSRLAKAGPYLLTRKMEAKVLIKHWFKAFQDIGLIEPKLKFT